MKSSQEKGQSLAAELLQMRRWRWVQYDPDGFQRSVGLELSEVINRLAMDGHSAPQKAVLSLLTSGHLTAFGDFEWRKYQWGNFFRRADFGAEIGATQWRTLQAAIDEEQRELAAHGMPTAGVVLEKLGLEDCSDYEWNFGDNRFSTALCPPETSVRDKSYFEEWFSAWNIEVRLAEDSPDALTLRPTHEPAAAPPVGRPLAAWWPDFVAELVAYVVEAGLPLGIGHQGQTEVIRDVCARLQERGKEEPSRAQIQEAVNAVLRRMRSAGN